MSNWVIKKVKLYYSNESNDIYEVNHILNQPSQNVFGEQVIRKVKTVLVPKAPKRGATEKRRLQTVQTVCKMKIRLAWIRPK